MLPEEPGLCRIVLGLPPQEAAQRDVAEGPATVPITADRLPVGLQIIGPRFEEPKILTLAKLVQQANPIGWPPVAN